MHRKTGVSPRMNFSHCLAKIHQSLLPCAKYVTCSKYVMQCQMNGYPARRNTTGTCRIILVRHGESESNVGLPTKTPESISLTHRGCYQSRELAQRWNGNVGLVITSNYLRARQTAEPTLSKYDLSPLIWKSVREFTYLEPSNWIGTTVKERASAVRTYWSRCDPTYIDGEGAESFNLFSKRVLSTIHELLSLVEMEHVVVFCHEQFIKAFIWCVVSNKFRIINMEEFRDFSSVISISNCSQVQFTVSNGRSFESVTYARLGSAHNE